MMASPYCVVAALLLLPEVSRLGEGVSNPGFVARITRKGLEYAHQYGMAILKKELSTINLPDLSGSVPADLIGSVSYQCWSLGIRNFQLGNSHLSLLPGQGIAASLSNNYMSVYGNWKVKKAFITLQGTFDLSVNDVSISVSLKLGKDKSGRPTASVTHCSNSVGHVSIHISGSLSWLLNLFHNVIENKLKKIAEEKICEIVEELTTSHLKPYLRTLPVTLKIDQVAFINYCLVGAPQVTSEGLDIPFKGKFSGHGRHTKAPFDAPPIKLPQEHDLMIYFAVSEYVFNTASWVYYQAGHMNFTIRSEHLAKLYTNMELELEVSPESAPCLMFTPGNVTLVPVINIQAFTLLPDSLDRELLFQLRVRTNISATISVSSNRIWGSLTPGSKLKLELIQSNIDFLNEQLMESVLNYYATYLIYPSVNAKLAEGFPFPLPRDIYLNGLQLRIHKNFLLIGANMKQVED
ncbi:lipopolysaccharide-binding protein-like [Artibeus jamaicensis]|uniref:lipopolysaccharide-binding protein-like n=1 Tax=Artibeus jamaicensis TaxID=9417 RepID=UPI00235B071D|nr:lipopolysaccharide-binding protein-like [Artibeus jamaicensis]XP_053526989.1 lipopolysaccharide-binding protein-like [Artibeus jamaicensis]